MMEELGPQELEDLVQELEGEAETGVRVEEASGPVDEAAQHLEQAFAFEDEDEYEKALEECHTAIRLDPTLADAHNLRGVILEELAWGKEAVLAYREALRLEPGFDAAAENLEAAEAELEAAEGHDQQISASEERYEKVGNSFMASVFHDPRWRWAPVYAVFLLVATALAFAVTSIWTVLAAGVVWFAGGVLGLVILGRKGYGTGGSVLSVLDMFDDNSSCSLYLWLVLLVLFALAGPVILLMALFISPRDSVVGVSKQRAEAKTAGRRKPSPVQGGDQPLDCSVCGAWNAPGSENCGECGAVLEGAAV